MFEAAFKEACSSGARFTQITFYQGAVWRFTGFDWVRMSAAK